MLTMYMGRTLWASTAFVLAHTLILMTQSVSIDCICVYLLVEFNLVVKDVKCCGRMRMS